MSDLNNKPQSIEKDLESMPPQNGLSDGQQQQSSEGKTSNEPVVQSELNLDIIDKGEGSSTIPSPNLPIQESKQYQSKSVETYNKGTKKKPRAQSYNRKKPVQSEINKNTTEEKTLQKGYLLEYRMKRLLFHMGYFPKIGIDVRTSYDDASDKITDLDVYGLYVHRDFTSKSLWVDCKSGSVQIHDRITWIKGIMSEITVNDMIFVVNSARTSVKQYARKAGIQLLDINIVDKLEADYKINQDDWRGSWNPDTQHNKINQLSKFSIPTNDLYKRIAKYISSDYWVIDNYSKVKKTLSGIRDLSTYNNLKLNEEQTKTIQWSIYELTNLFLLAVLDIAKELYYFNDSEKRETVVEGLSSGDIPNRKRKEIFDSAFRVAYNVVKTQIPDFNIPSKMPSFNITPPNYTESFIDLILRITNNPMYYYDLLRFLDFIFMEYDLQSKVISEADVRTLFKNYDELLIGAKTLLHFICQVTNIPRSMYRIIN
ncbi:hypothetical protein [Paenibacillus sp. YIM B09110]|uniref:hypothetical protein n=1 Tax=Paenibacillus sp. YIM B09110 TaxID=3126102 RepID=UPI00301CDDA0